ncbi:hypothetical protein EWH99_06830 [Sporolactobacillus sp. THM7-7]|nr:hypothetical protein EWH99_06830 [Sporolactobacillus sp. THM7-7]
MKRIMIEVTVILCVLLLCILYGAVTMREAQQDSGAPSAEAEPVYNLAQTQQEDAVSQEEPKVQEESSPLKNAGESLADKVSRFFLWAIGIVASVVESVLHSFV